MDLNKLRIFHSVALYGSLKKASLNIKMASSNISSSINTLEENLSEQLFVRHYKGMELTEAGKKLYSSTKNIFDEVRYIENSFDKKKHTNQEICISTTWGVSSSDWMVKKLVEAKKKFPFLKIKIVDFNPQDIYEISADAYISPYIYSHNNLVHSKVKTFIFKLFAHKCYLDKYGYPSVPDDLDTHSLISFSSELKNPFSSVDSLLHKGREDGNPRYISYETNSSIGLLKMVERGIGIAVLSVEASKNPSIISVIDNLSYESEIYLSYDKRNKGDKKTNIINDIFF